MKIQIWIIYRTMTWTSRHSLRETYGKAFCRQFEALSGRELSRILAEMPAIGDSIFALNYCYGPCYFAWYAALRGLGVEKEAALEWIWRINEAFIRSFPRPLLRWFARNMYLGAFRKKAPIAEADGKAGRLHPFDWRVEYVDISPDTFGLNITECAMLKLAAKFGYLELFPTVCRMDYLFSHYFENGFTRQGTLADGDACCDCIYTFRGSCEWAPEKGFMGRR